MAMGIRSFSISSVQKAKLLEPHLWDEPGTKTEPGDDT